MRRIRVVQMLAVICAMWAAVWLSDGNEASAKERAAGAIIMVLVLVMLIVQHLIEEKAKKKAKKRTDK